ncbi:MAG: hypothetical protein J0H74_27705 [Chitinophagaceae bacterium]|nr:hypothetical protein [Chitinophagaceae bacterium]
MRPKGLFFSLPSVSVSRTLTSVIDGIAAAGYDIIYYNTADFRPVGDHAFSFRSYPENFEAHYSEKINEGISYFEFGEILIDAAAGVMDFLVGEIARERPCFVLHSHLAVWGKLIAMRYGLPAVTLFTTFILDKRIMLPFFRQLNAGKSGGLGHVSEAVNVYRKWRNLYVRLQLKGEPDLWDVYINKGQLNLSFILPSFQPRRDILGPEYRFMGYPLEYNDEGAKKELIYVAMGTILNKDIAFYLLCIDVLKDLQIDCVLSVGAAVCIGELGEIPGHIRVEKFTRQPEVLQRSRLFITRGGMASVHESVYARTPMIVIPMIPEQQQTAGKVQELGIGIHIPTEQLTRDRLKAAIREILDNEATYTARLDVLSKEFPVSPPQTTASEIVDGYLKSVI